MIALGKILRDSPPKIEERQRRGEGGGDLKKKYPTGQVETRFHNTMYSTLGEELF